MMNYPPPLVSIGMPTYNRADKYLKQALGSAVKQTYPNIEIIVSDNCSTDNTEAVVKMFDDPRIRYYKQDINIGLVNNANFCLEKATGSYFMQLHDDDMIDHDFIETCMKSADFATDKGIIRTGTRVIDSDNNVIQESYNCSAGLSTTEFFRSWFSCKTSIYLCSTLYNTEKIKEMGGFWSKHNLFEDVVSIARLSKFGRVDISEIKASFRKHSSETTFSADIKEWCEDSLYLLDIMSNLVDDQEKKIFRKEGVKFLSTINYGFAGNIKSPVKRFNAYIKVFKIFNYKHLPPPLKKFSLYINPLHGLKYARKKVKRIFF